MNLDDIETRIWCPVQYMVSLLSLSSCFYRYWGRNFVSGDLAPIFFNFIKLVDFVEWSKIFIVDDMARAPDPRFVQSMQEKGPICLSLECRIRKKNLKYFKLTKTKVMKKSLKGKNNQWTGYEIFIYSLWLDKEKRYIIID